MYPSFPHHPFATDGIVGQEYEHGAVAFFDLAGGLSLALMCAGLAYAGAALSGALLISTAR